MLSLQALTSQNIIDNLVINDETKPILEQFLLDYLNKNPKFTNDYLDKNGLYHVYFRQRDPLDCRKRDQKDMILLKSFLVEQNAIDWILKNGKKIIEEYEENYIDNRFVLTIVPSDNSGDYEVGEEPTQFYFISGKHYLNFAYSFNGYKMLLKEYVKICEYNYYQKSPTWIHFYKEDGTHIIGAPIEELKNMGVSERLIDFYQHTI